MKNYGLEFEAPIYIRPKYVSSRGEATEIAFADKSIKIEYKTIKTVLKKVFLDACVDKAAVKLKASEITGKKNLVPLYVNSSLLLVPLKMRKPLVQGDVSYGYVNYFVVDKIGKDNSEYTIRFFNGMTVPILGSGASIRRACGDAAMLLKAYRLKANFNNINNPHKYFYGERGNPATKSDIEELKREIWMIKEIMGL